MMFPSGQEARTGWSSCLLATPLVTGATSWRGRASRMNRQVSLQKFSSQIVVRGWMCFLSWVSGDFGKEIPVGNEFDEVYLLDVWFSLQFGLTVFFQLSGLIGTKKNTFIKTLYSRAVDHFNANLKSGSESCLSKGCESATTGQQAFHGSILSLHASIVSVHGLWWLHFEL